MLCNGSGHFNWSSSEEQKGGFSVFALVQGQLATDVDRDLDIDMDMDIGIVMDIDTDIMTGLGLVTDKFYRCRHRHRHAFRFYNMVYVVLQGRSRNQSHLSAATAYV